MKQKQKAPQGPIILDVYKNTILTIAAVVLILMAFVPLVVFGFNSFNSKVSFEGDDAKEVYQKLLQDFDVSRHQKATIEYTNLDSTWVREQFNFMQGQLASRVVFESAAFEETPVFQEEHKTVYRRIKASDEAAVIASGVDLSGGFQAYLLTTTDCIKETYILSPSNVYQIQLPVEVDITDALGAAYSTLEVIFEAFTSGAEIVSVNADMDYNFFGLGYKFGKADFNDANGNSILFKENRIVITLDSGEVYKFSFKIE